MLNKLALLAAGVLAATLVHAETYVVCIGINDYPTPPGKEGTKDDPDLKGCLNDIRDYKKIFVDKFGVKESNIRTLLDKDANIDNFLRDMKWLVSTAKPGDQIAFVYSGHGGQVPDKSEADGYEEVIVLADDNLIAGDLFGELANALNEKGVNSTYIFDSCFSGGMSRDASGGIQVRNKSLGVIKPKSAEAIIDATVGFQKATNVAKGGYQGPKGASLFMFASQEGKTSSDISGMQGIDAHGLFSLLLTSSLSDSPKASIKDLYGLINATLDDVNKKLKEKGSDRQFTQGPNFETSAERAGGPVLLPG